MNVNVGDRLILDGDPDREAVIIGIRNPDGTPPYVVRWLSDGHISLFSPGPFVRIAPGHQQDGRPGPQRANAADPGDDGRGT